MHNPDNTEPVGLTPDELQQYIDSHTEKEYLLIDVRQPLEYELGHIPGARLMPLLDYEARLFDLAGDKDLVFYCRNGGRSLAASILATEAEVSTARIYNLTGGIMAWYGKTLTDFPRVQIFDLQAGLADMLFTAMGLEKGAWRFYQHVSDHFSEQTITPIFEKLAAAETAHAHTIYNIWRSNRPAVPPFDQLFENLQGNIIEGGQTLEDVLTQLPVAADNICMDLVELALHIEYAAFDLYRVLAEQNEDPGLNSTFLSLAQAEKGHMRMLIQAVAHCSNS